VPVSRFLKRRATGAGIKPAGTVESFTPASITSPAVSRRNCAGKAIAGCFEFCDTHGIRHEVCGKVIVATTESEVPMLEKLYARGVENGLSVRKLTASQVKELEPHVSCLAGLHVRQPES